MGVSSQAATELQLRFLPAYCWQLLPRLPLRPTLLSSMELIHMLLEFMELIHMPHTWFLPPVWSLVTLSLLLLVAIRLLLDPMETLLDPSMRFPALSQLLPFKSKNLRELLA